MLIDDKYFITGRTEIAGINIQSGGEISKQASKLQNHINEWVFNKEPIYLRAMLGEELYGKMYDEYQHIRRHRDYEHGKDSLFVKVRDILVDDNRRRSPIAMYVYFFYERNRASFTTVAGERVKKTNDSTAVSPMFKLVELWNDMVDWNFRIVEDLERKGIRIKPNFDNEIFHKINAFGL